MLFACYGWFALLSVLLVGLVVFNCVAGVYELRFLRFGYCLWYLSWVLIFECCLRLSCFIRLRFRLFGAVL